LWKSIRWIFRIIIWCAIAVAIFFGYGAYKKYRPIVDEYRAEADEIVANSSIKDFKAVQTSYIYDCDGKQIAKLKTDKDINYLSYDEFPEDLVNAVVAIEDKRFWEHEGVDWQSTALASYLYLKNPNDITRGGSTITQQLVKNIYLSNEKSIERKVKEIFIALGLEEKYSKKQIIEFYLNNINYANGYYGIGAAAKGYFNKSVDKLTLNEIAFLCAIPNNPTYYDPLTNIKNTTKRRNLILSEMYSQEYVSEEEYLVACNSPIHFNEVKAKNYNYVTSYAIDCSVRFLMEQSDFKFQYSFKSEKEYTKYRKKYLEAYDSAKEKLYTGGYRINTSINQKVQKKLQKIVNKNLRGFTSKSKDGIYELQGAATVVNNKTGKVIAIVGGRSQNFNGVLTLNRAYQSYRQPGSTIKPLIVYTPAIEQGYTPNSLVNDSYSSDGPRNSDGTYLGWITMRTAVEKSKNVVAWNLFNAIGPQKGLSYVQAMGFSKIVPSDYYLSSALGGLTYGVTTVEMASAYRTLANDGKFTEPTCITRVRMASGLDLDLNFEEKRVYSEDAARVMTDILQGVAKNGTAKGLVVGKGMPVACKTGTTNNQTNGWFCGYTPYYSVACYVGYDESKSVSNLWGSTYPMSIWRDIQNYLCRNKKIVKFKKKRVRKVTVQATSKPAGNYSEDSDDGNSNYDYSYSSDNSSSDSGTTVQTEEDTTSNTSVDPKPESKDNSTKKNDTKSNDDVVVEEIEDDEPSSDDSGSDVEIEDVGGDSSGGSDDVDVSDDVIIE
jgi:1A family penicillin-binding protein